MEEFKGTKERWVFDAEEFLSDDKSAYVSTMNSGWTIAEVFDGSGYTHTDAIKANAQLIASAPELLDALQGLLKSTYPNKTFDDGSDHEADVALRAINKALGKQ